MPRTQPKLSRKPGSKTDKGLYKSTTMPARPIEFNLSYCLPKIFASDITKNIMLALTTDTENEHKQQ